MKQAHQVGQRNLAVEWPTFDTDDVLTLRRAGKIVVIRLDDGRNNSGSVVIAAGSGKPISMRFDLGPVPCGMSGCGAE